MIEDEAGEAEAIIAELLAKKHRPRIATERYPIYNSITLGTLGASRPTTQ